MRELDGRLFHRHREGESAIMANLDDYAFLIWGLIECYEASFDASFLKTALSLQADLTKHFWDKEHGGYFFTPDDGEDLIIREKESYDGAIPSGNLRGMPTWKGRRRISAVPLRLPSGVCLRVIPSL
jgi:uncharacterized protein YyaL (SSP411 family)